MTPDRKSFPPREDCRGVCGLYLLRIAGVVEPHQHIVPFVRGAVYCVTHDDNAIANIDRVQHGRQHTNMGLRSRDDQRVCLALAQVLDQPGFGEGGIACFVDKRRGRAKRAASTPAAGDRGVRGYGHLPLRERLFGGVTYELIHHVPVPLRMAH